MACAGAPDRAPPLWRAPEAETHARYWICQLASDCASIRIKLVDSEGPSATLWFGIELELSRGLYVAVSSETELVFVLAHELAHRDLQHRPPRDLGERLPIELEADRWAVQRLCALGLDALAGRVLVTRFLQAEHDLAAQRETSNSGRDAKRSAMAIRELTARQGLDFSCRGKDNLAPAPKLDPETFQRLRALATQSTAIGPNSVR